MRRIFPALFLSLFLSPLLNSSPAFADDQAPPPANPVQEVQGAWNALLEESQASLAEVRAGLLELQQKLPALADPIRTALPAANAELKQLSALAQVSQNMPAELAVVGERARRLTEQLALQNSNLNNSLTALNARLDELAELDVDVPESSDDVMKTFHAQLASAQKLQKQIQLQIAAILAPVDKLQTDVAALRDRIEKNMPTLWRNYYTSPAGKVFDPLAWRLDLKRTGSILTILSLRIGTELPPTATDWLFTLMRVLVAGLPLLLLLLISRRMALKSPYPMLRDGWPRVTTGSGVWIALGLALYYAAVGGGGIYQVLASLAVITLCWGQLYLAWDLTCVARGGEGKRLSPLAVMFPPLLLGMALLYFDTFPIILTVGWLLVLAVAIRQNLRRPAPEDKLAQGVLSGLTFVLWISVLMSLFGFTRLSIILCAAYTALAVCIQQDVAIVRIANRLEAALPDNSSQTLVARLLLALLVPLALLVATLAPALWILAYPGGSYLLRHTAGLGFSVGAVSLNIMQILSIFIAFYLVRTLISLGKMFIQSLQKNRSSIGATLAGPFQTAYTYLLWACFGLYVLHALGFSLSSLALVAGGLSVGVGFGLQNIVQNFVSGLMVIFGQVIREGDVVEVGSVTGQVKRIHIRSTQVETFDNAVVFIPNSQFLSSSFTNWTHNGLSVRKDISVGVAYGSDLGLCMKLLQEAAAAHPKVMAHPAPSVSFTNFADSSLTLILRYWVADYYQGVTITSDIRLKVNEMFQEHGISIAFPQIDVHMVEEGAGAAPVTK